MGGGRGGVVEESGSVVCEWWIGVEKERGRGRGLG